MIFYLIACLSSNDPVPDPWIDCPEAQQCLSGDIVSNEAKSCCASDEVCVAGAPKEGGECKPKPAPSASKNGRTDDAVQANSSSGKPKEPVAPADTPDTQTEGVKISEALIPGTNTQTKPLKQPPNAKDFVGYDILGKKLSLPERCAICKRIKTEEEKAFLRQCKEQGGKTKACGCLTLLCSVKVE